MSDDDSASDQETDAPPRAGRLPRFVDRATKMFARIRDFLTAVTKLIKTTGEAVKAFINFIQTLQTATVSVVAAIAVLMAAMGIFVGLDDRSARKNPTAAGPTIGTAITGKPASGFGLRPGSRDDTSPAFHRGRCRAPG